MDRFRMPALCLQTEKKDNSDPMNKYRIKDGGGSGPATPVSVTSPTSADSAVTDEEELRSLTKQLASFNRKLTEENLDKYKIKATQGDGKQQAAGHHEQEDATEPPLDDEERRKLEAEMQRLLTRKHTLELRRTQREAAPGLDRFRRATGAPATPSTATASTTSSVPALAMNGPASAPVTPKEAESLASPSAASLKSEIDKSRRLSTSDCGAYAKLHIAPSSPSSATTQPKPQASFNKPIATSSGPNFATPKVKMSFGLPPARSQASAATADPFSKYRIQSAADGAADVKATSASQTTVIADAKPLAAPVSDPFSKYRIASAAAAADGATTQAEPVVRSEAGKPHASDPLSKYRTAAAAAPPARPAVAVEVESVEEVKSQRGKIRSASPESAKPTEEKKSTVQAALDEEERFLWKSMAKFGDQ